MIGKGRGPQGSSTRLGAIGQVAFWRSGWAVLGWTLLGALVRFWNLGGKPPSSIEVASIGFGLGNGFDHLPLDRLVSLAELLEPLRVQPTVGLDETIARLAAQSTHPPLFFGLMHGWLRALTPAGGLVDLATARSLSALLGCLAIPAGFWLAQWLAGHLVPPQDGAATPQPTDRPVAALWMAHGVAALLALSPYGVAMAQEARHYTLAILWAIGTWSATFGAIHRLQQGRSPGWGLGMAWVLGNGLSLATHYFCLLGIAAQGLAISWLAWSQGRSQGWSILRGRPWRVMGVIALAQIALAAAWLPAMAGASESELTAWIREDLSPAEWFLPPLRLLAWLATMVVLLPVEQQPLPVILGSAIALLAVLGLLLRMIGPVWRSGLARPAPLWWAISIGIVGPLVLMLLSIYSDRGDLSVAPRYQFVHFPLVVLGVGLALGQRSADRAPLLIGRWQGSGRSAMVAILVVSLLGSLAVANNWGFLKSRQVDRLWDQIEGRSTHTPLLVSHIETYAEIRGTVAIAYEWQRRQALQPHQRPAQSPNSPQFAPQFLMLQEASDRADAQAPLAQVIQQQAHPFDLWTVDLSPALDLEAYGCKRAKDRRRPTGYRLRHYQCTKAAS